MRRWRLRSSSHPTSTRPRWSSTRPMHSSPRASPSSTRSRASVSAWAPTPSSSPRAWGWTSASDRTFSTPGSGGVARVSARMSRPSPRSPKASPITPSCCMRSVTSTGTSACWSSTSCASCSMSYQVASSACWDWRSNPTPTTCVTRRASTSRKFCWRPEPMCAPTTRRRWTARGSCCPTSST